MNIKSFFFLTRTEFGGTSLVQTLHSVPLDYFDFIASHEHSFSHVIRFFFSEWSIWFDLCFAISSWEVVLAPVDVVKLVMSNLSVRFSIFAKFDNRCHPVRFVCSCAPTHSDARCAQCRSEFFGTVLQIRNKFMKKKKISDTICIPAICARNSYDRHRCARKNYHYRKHHYSRLHQLTHYYFITMIKASDRATFDSLSLFVAASTGRRQRRRAELVLSELKQSMG